MWRTCRRLQATAGLREAVLPADSSALAEAIRKAEQLGLDQ